MTKLFVPIELQGFLINKRLINTLQGYSRWKIHYRTLLEDFTSPTPPPFSSSTPKSGFEILWQLPWALSHGQENQPLFTIEEEIESICRDLNAGKISAALFKAFETFQMPLSAKGLSLSPLEENNSWLLVDWPRGYRYKIKRQVKGLLVQNASLDFPKVPNRFLITRTESSDPKRSLKSWIVQSDYLDPFNGENSFIDPFSSSPKATMLGKSEVLTSTWKDPNPDQLFLRAVGPGDATFSVYAPNANNVFCFRDPEGTELATQSNLTYSVIGWYSKESEDPLAHISEETFAKRLEELNWQLNSKTPPSSIPSSCLFHGMFHSVSCKRDTIPYSQNPFTYDDPAKPSRAKSTAKNVKVAVGNTTVDALSALIERESEEVGERINPQLMEAFQYGLLEALNDPDAKAQIEQAAQQERFGSSPGGTVWNITVAENQDKDHAPPDIPPFAPDLATLNKDQKRLDDLHYQVLNLQWEYYARWWKGKRLNEAGYVPDEIYDQIEEFKTRLEPGSDDNRDLVTKIQNAKKEITTLQTKLPDPNQPDEIVNYAKTVLKLPEGLELKPSKMPRFWHANDPVILASGLETTRTISTKQTISCRLQSELITGLTVSEKKINRDSLQELLPSVCKNSDLPQEIQSLYDENYFLNPNHSTAIATKTALKVNEIDEARTKKSWASQSSFAPEDFACRLWKQAWIPLFLEWEIQWYPTYRLDGTGWAFDREHWQFDGDEYRWKGEKSDLPDISKNEHSQIYKGRTFLSEGASVNFQESLKKYIEQHDDAELKKIEELIEKLQGWDLLSQSISGLLNQFTMRRDDQNLPPDGEAAPIIEDQYHSLPNPDPGEIDSDFPFFHPHRAGFFFFKRLRVVDCFGQCADLLYANGNNVPISIYNRTFSPILSNTLKPEPFRLFKRLRMMDGSVVKSKEANQPLIQLSPSTLQPTRLDFHWVDAADDSKEVNISSDANPICGWILPNHLDDGLSIYNSQGQFLNELITKGDRGVGWAYNYETREIDNPHLKEIAENFIGEDRQPHFKNFLKSIDETLWIVDPHGNRKDQSLSLLIGRPLAFVRAKLQLITQDGEFLYNQSWIDTFGKNDGGLSSTLFAIRLGNPQLQNESLIGYFFKNNLDFHGIHIPASVIDEHLIPIDQNEEHFLKTTLNGDPLYATLLIDPRGSFHASTGILPVRETTLPSRFVDKPLAEMEVNFRMGPLITDPLKENVLSLVMPKLQEGIFKWYEQSGPEKFQSFGVENAPSTADLPDAQRVIREGWLQLSQEK